MVPAPVWNVRGVAPSRSSVTATSSMSAPAIAPSHTPLPVERNRNRVTTTRSAAPCSESAFPVRASSSRMALRSCVGPSCSAKARARSVSSAGSTLTSTCGPASTWAAVGTRGGAAPHAARSIASVRTIGARRRVERRGYSRGTRLRYSRGTIRRSTTLPPCRPAAIAAGVSPRLPPDRRPVTTQSTPCRVSPLGRTAEPP